MLFGTIMSSISKLTMFLSIERLGVVFIFFTHFVLIIDIVKLVLTGASAHYASLTQLGLFPPLNIHR